MVNATVSGGIVTGITAGTDPISYSVTKQLWNCFQLYRSLQSYHSRLRVVISGSSGVCVGSGITLFDAAPGGSWVASNAKRKLWFGPGIIDGVYRWHRYNILCSNQTVCGTSTTSKNNKCKPIAFCCADLRPNQSMRRYNY